MTRKDYIVIADGLNRAKPIAADTKAKLKAIKGQWRTTCEYMCDVLAADNMNFNRDIFLKACGVE